MAYPTACSSCTRIMYWSNPYVLYGSGNVPMGTTTSENNARVWNEQSDIIMAFRQPDNNITITVNDIPNTQYADIIAKQDITTSGSIMISNGNNLSMRAGNKINLKPGFSVSSANGSEFIAKIENIYDCGTNSLILPKVIVQNVPDEDSDLDNIQNNTKPDFSYSVFPNPTDEFVNITYALDTDIFLSIELVNLFGQKIISILPKQYQQIGTYTLQVPVSNFSSGTYFLVISSINQQKIEKIIIN